MITQKFMFHFRFSKIKQQIGKHNKIHLIHQLHFSFLFSMPPPPLLLIIFTFLPLLILASTQSVQLLSSSADNLSLVSGLTARFQCSVYRCGPSETKPPSVFNISTKFLIYFDIALLVQRWHSSFQWHRIRTWIRCGTIPNHFATIHRFWEYYAAEWSKFVQWRGQQIKFLWINLGLKLFTNYSAKSVKAISYSKALNSLSKRW